MTDNISNHIELHSIRLEEKSKYNINDLTGIANKCDMFICNNDVIYINETDIPRVIFIKTEYSSIKTFIFKVKPMINWPIVLIIGGDDYTFPKGTGDMRINYYSKDQNLVNELIDSEIINRIWVENLDTYHAKLRPLPTGYHDIRNLTKYSLYKPYLSITNINYANRSSNIFCCHIIRDDTSQWDIRKLVTQFALTKWKEYVNYVEDINDEQYINYLIQSKFCLCVEGGGIDPSPKAWQALICGCVPIIKSSTLNEAYKRFPIIFIDTWTEDIISEERIKEWEIKYEKFYSDDNNRIEVLRMLKLDYWWNLIQEDLN
jgi:hypothetical protein